MLMSEDWICRRNCLHLWEPTMAEAGWEYTLVDEDTLVVHTTKGRGVDLQDYHWSLLDDHDWLNWRGFVRGLARENYTRRNESNTNQ